MLRRIWAAICAAVAGVGDYLWWMCSLPGRCVRGLYDGLFAPSPISHSATVPEMPTLADAEKQAVEKLRKEALQQPEAGVSYRPDEAAAIRRAARALAFNRVPLSTDVGAMSQRSAAWLRSLDQQGLELVGRAEIGAIADHMQRKTRLGELSWLQDVKLPARSVVMSTDSPVPQPVGTAPLPDTVVLPFHRCRMPMSTDERDSDVPLKASKL